MFLESPADINVVAGDPAYETTERLIASQPHITVPTVVLDPTQDGLGPPESRSEHEAHFTNLVAFSSPHSGGRLVEQEYAGVGGHAASDLDPSLSAIWQGATAAVFMSFQS